MTSQRFSSPVCTEHSEGESLFYIISPKDIVVAKERDQDDHIDWLLDKKKYEVSGEEAGLGQHHYVG